MTSGVLSDEPNAGAEEESRESRINGGRKGKERRHDTVQPILIDVGEQEQSINQ